MSKALVLVDIQNDYFSNGKMELVGMEAAGQNANMILQKCRKEKLSIFHIQHIALDLNAPFFIPESLGVEIHEMVKPFEGEIIVKKNYPNSFRETTLQNHLRENGIDELVICGSMSHMCIDTTVRAAFDLGYKCTLIEDACATIDMDFKGTKVEASKVHASFMSALSYPFAHVISTEEYCK
ncbi:cysteine hydrolase family protein [Ancylomarina longa]|uniref:Cysteine hydrolase n=1 Tax=Ancylomarina longa TaxID=2487017 RepID=A0A434AXZ1_9BACT|nr:cysteine hydrolase family protein [Ancylomarina longa]RUT79422.1 cysteine hydrolase [Ancylomarina longa]